MSKRVPKRRFSKKDLSLKWKSSKIKDLCSISTGKSNTQDKSVEGQYPFYVRSPIIEKSNKYIFDEEAVLTVGDGVGTGKVFHYVNGKYDLHQRVYRMYNFVENISGKFFYYYFSHFFYDRVMSMTAKTSVDSVRLEMIAEMSILYPSKDEQKKIVEWLDNINHLINFHQQKYDKLQALKKAYLYEMFPQEGENVPKRRFAGFSGDWEKKQLKNIAQVNPASTIPDIFEYVDLESVVGTRLISHRKEYKKTAPSRAQRVANDGDIFYQTVRPYQKNNYFFKCKDNKRYVFSTGYAQIRTSINSEFLFSLLQTDAWVKQVMKNCTGTSYPAINANILAELNVLIPKEQEEQSLIARYFNILDDKILYYSHKLQKLKALKQAYLAEMFV